MSWVSFFWLCVFETQFIQTRNEIHWNKESTDFDDLGRWDSHGPLPEWQAHLRTADVGALITIRIFLSFLLLCVCVRLQSFQGSKLLLLIRLVVHDLVCVLFHIVGIFNHLSPRYFESVLKVLDPFLSKQIYTHVDNFTYFSALSRELKLKSCSLSCPKNLRFMLQS